MIKNIIKTAWRNLLHQKKTSIINIAGLSLGMTTAILIIIWVQNEIHYDNYHADANQIYRITNYMEVNKGNTWVWETSPYNYGAVIQKQIPEIEMVARIRDASWAPLIFRLHNQLYKEKKLAFVDSNWFNMFSYGIVAGNLNAFNENRYSLAITESKAKKYFGESDPIGQIMQVDSIGYTIQAVLKDNPVNSSFQYDFFVPVSAWQANPQNARNDAGWNNFMYLTFIKLHKKANIALVETKLSAILKANKDKSTAHSQLVKLPDMHFETNLQQSVIRHSDRKTVAIFSILALLLLLTASINYVNLTTARASLRAKEVSIRKIVGAAKWHLFWQFVTESFMISLLSLLLTLILITFCLPFFNILTDNHFTLVLTDPEILKILLGTIAFITILNGVYPAFLLSSFKPLNIFRGVSILNVKDHYFRKGLVILQFSISVMLIIGTIVIYRQMQLIQSKHDGYNKSQIVNISLPWKLFKGMPTPQQTSFMETIKQDLAKESSISEVSVADNNIINNTGLSSGGFDWDGREKDFDPPIARLSADADFPKMFNLQLKEGRWFRDHDKADEKGYVINETAAKELKIHTPLIGQRFVNGGDTGMIIGVVRDFNYKSIHDRIGPLIIYNEPYWRLNIFAKINPGQAANALHAIEKKWKTILPDTPFEYNFLDETFDKLYETDRKTAVMILTFSLIAAFISAMGLFGLAAFTTERRTKEVGIRKVLGASIKNIVVLLSKEFVYLVLLSILIAAPLAWLFMNKWLANFAYHITITPWIFLMAGIIAIIIALLTVSLQAIKAALTNPAKSLRTE